MMASPGDGETTSIETTTSTVKHKLEIPGTLVTMGVGVASNWFASPQSQGGLYWRIFLDPMTVTVGSKRKVSLQLATGHEMRLFSTNPSLTQVPSGHRVTVPSFTAGVTVRKKNGDLNNFPAKTDLIYLSTIFPMSICEIVVENVNIEINVEIQQLMFGPQKYKRQSGHAELKEHGSFIMSMLLKESVLPDVALQVQGELGVLGAGVLMAHRAVLAANSPVFKAMFTHDTTESKTGKVDVKGIRGDVMSEVLRYMYTGQVSTDDSVLVMDILHAAERYELLSLKAICEDCLILDPPADMLQMLFIADTNNAVRLKAAALDSIANHSNPEEIVNDRTLKEVMERHPGLVKDLLMVKFKSVVKT